MKVSRVAALDAGSNSFHVIVAEVDEAGDFRIIDRAKEMVRLGEGTLVTRRIPESGFARGLEALARLRRRVAEHKPVTMLAAATAAVREADNGAAFVRAARDQAGVDLRVVSGSEEARLVYLGARRSLGASLGTGPRRVALFDLGGGSLEIIVADSERIHFSRSLPLGGLRLAQTWPLTDPPRGAALSRMRAMIHETLAPTMAEIGLIGYRFVALASGTANAVRGILAKRDESAVPPARASLRMLTGLERELADMPAREREAVPGLDSKRVDSIVPGVAVLRTVVGLSGRGEAHFCSGTIREGMIADYLAQGGRTSSRTPAAAKTRPLRTLGAARGAASA